MRYILPFFMLLFCFFAFPSSSILSQKDDKNGMEELSPKDLNNILNILSQYDKKIEAALSSDKKTYQAMKNEIENISNLKKDSEKISAISAYQKKYLNFYNSALKNAGVDFNEVVKALKKKYDKFEITQINNVIIFKSSTNFNPPANFNTDITEIVKLDDFEDSRELSCGGISGGNVSITSNSIEATSRATDAGVCKNIGSKSLQYTTPKNVKSVVFKVKGKLVTECYAVGVIGASYSNNAAYLSPFGSVGSSVFAPILWCGHDLDELSINYEGEFQKGYSVQIAASCVSESLSMVCCGTNGRAKVSNIDAKVYIKR